MLPKQFTLFPAKTAVPLEELLFLCPSPSASSLSPCPPTLVPLQTLHPALALPAVM